jgi:hypothetical protein
MTANDWVSMAFEEVQRLGDTGRRHMVDIYHHSQAHQGRQHDIPADRRQPAHIHLT